MFDITKMKRDKNKAREGVTVQCDDGLEITVISSTDCAAYKEMMVAGNTKKGRRGRTEPIGTTALLALNVKAMAKHILKGWNIEDTVNGEVVALECNEANALAVFDACPEILDDVIRESGDPRNFRLVVEEDIKNSDAS